MQISIEVVYPYITITFFLQNLIEEIAMTMNSSNGTGHVEGALQKRRDACLKLASASSEMQEKVKGGVRAHIEKRVIQVKLAQLEVGVCV